MEHKCWDCNKKAAYRDNKGGIYCAKCYWNLDENEERKKNRKFNTYDDTDAYINCPHCGAGDLCEKKAGCIRQCKNCQIINLDKDIDGYCSLDCQEEVQDKQEELIQKELDTSYDKIIPLQNKDNLDKEDLLIIKQLQVKIEKLLKKRINSHLLKGNIEDLKDTLQDLEIRVSQGPNDDTICCRYCQVKTNSIFDVCQKEACLTKMNEEIERNNNPNQRKKQQLQKRIKELENKPNKTPAEEQELIDKQKQLKNLTNPNNNQTNNHDWIKPTLIIGGVAIVVIGVIYLLNNKQKKK